MPSIDLTRYKQAKPEKKNGKSNSVLEILNKDIQLGNGQLADKKKQSFYLEISTLLQSGIDLKSALDLILVDAGKGKDRALFESVKDRVVQGSALSDSVNASGRFSDYEHFSIRIGEETGQLGEVLKELAGYYKSKIQQRRKIISAITYPAIVMMTSVGAVFFMMKFVVPMFADVFQRFGGKLPWITDVILRIAGGFERYGIFMFLILAAFCIFSFMNRNADWFRKYGAAIVLQLPLAGDIVRKIYLARFANTMRLLVRTDIPLLRAIGLVRQMINFYPIEFSLQVVEHEILKGCTLNSSLGKFDFYPPKMIQLIKVGEEVNRLHYFFGQLSEQYTEEVEYKTNTIGSMLEPLIIVFLGLVVGIILIAMYLPMFQMSNSF